MSGDIPVSAAPFFQEYSFPQLDSERHATLVIERILSYGNRVEVRWLFDRYGKERVQEWVQRSGEIRLPKRRYHLWCVLLDIPFQQTKKSLWAY